MFGAWNVWREWSTAGSNGDVRRSVVFTVYFNSVVVDEFGIAIQQRDVIVTQYAIVRCVNAGDISLAAGNQGFPTEVIYCDIKPVIWAVLVNRFGYLCAIPHRFFGYAAHVNAGTTNGFAFD